MKYTYQSYLTSSLANKVLENILQNTLIYSTSNNYLNKDTYPWLFNSTVPLMHPVVSTNTSKAYLQSSNLDYLISSQYTDWYSNTSSSYRNTANLYTK